MKNLFENNAHAVCLIKPQFEAGKENVGKKGVVRDKKVHIKVVEEIIDFSINECGLSVINLDYSPIKGPQGNIEYLIHLFNDGLAENRLNITAEEIVEQSHSDLDKKE